MNARRHAGRFADGTNRCLTVCPDWTHDYSLALLVYVSDAGVTRRKQHQPGITPNDNTTHVPTAGSSAALTKPNHTPTRHPRKRQNNSVNGHTPRRTKLTHTVMPV